MWIIREEVGLLEKGTLLEGWEGAYWREKEGVIRERGHIREKWGYYRKGHIRENGGGVKILV